MSRKTVRVIRTDDDKHVFLASDETLAVHITDTWYGRILVELKPEGVYEICLFDDRDRQLQVITGKFVSDLSRSRESEEKR
jgi:hypothetical protein